jgi:TolB-like protein/class 3 adenylate cyclase
VQKRLAVILAADVVGYSAMMEQDEAGTFARIVSLRKEILEPLIGQRRGRIFKLNGDGILAEFESALDAVECAVAIQNWLAGLYPAEPPKAVLALRIGINLGDVIIDGDDRYGEGVNIAARLEQLAAPGSIWVSGKVFEEVRGKSDVTFEDCGPQTLKNMSTPVRAFCIRSTVGGAFAKPAGIDIVALPSKASIVVLPFVNMTPDLEHEFFADGMTEDVITALSRIGDLFVISRNSSFVYKGKPVRIEVVARELGVKHVLEGSIRVSGGRIRITAQLIDGATGAHVWAERYDRRLDDVFEIQDEIVRHIALALQIKLAHGDFARLWDGQTSDLRAWETMAIARTHFLKFNPADNKEARRLLTNAIAMDSRFTGAMVLLGLTHWVDARFTMAVDRKVALRSCAEQAERAITIDPDMGSAHMLLGGVEFLSDRHDAALATCARAVALAPSDSWAMAFYGLVCNYSERPADGARAFRDAMRLSPHPPAWYTYGLAIAELWNGNFPEAERASRLNLLQEPDDPYSSVNLATVLAFQGKAEEARQVVSRLRARFTDFGFANIRRSERYRNPNDLEKVIAALGSVGLN